MTTFAFEDAGTTDRAILGGKGAGLVEMVALGLPVPPGFVIGTEAGRGFLETGELPAGLEAEIGERMAALERSCGRAFGEGLFVSVRSGAPVSMPGMMDTVLNVGLTRDNVGALGPADFAWTSFERLLDGFARTVRGIGAGVVEELFLDLPRDAGPRERSEALLALIEREGEPFPEPRGQLREAVDAVFRSWNSRRAQAYRRHKGIDDAMGTAVVIQRMVFGHLDERSGSGVAFTRDPSTGAPGAYGDFLFEAQGEDVVAGERDTDPLTVIAERLPEVHAELERALLALENDARDLCDVEFTIESGELYVLQTRVGQRSGRAAVRVAVDLADEDMITREEAVRRVSDEQLTAARAPLFGEDAPEILARGLPASSGAAVGQAAFDADRAQAIDGDVVLLRPTTSPMDLPGVLASTAVVTGRGGRTSHAAVVARGLGKPAVCGVGELRVSPDGRSATLEGQALEEGELLSVDGDRGIVSRGERQTVPAEQDETLARFLQWRAEQTQEATA